MSDKTDPSLKDLLQLLLQPPREVDGARVNNRMGYQKNWAIWKILTMHQEDRDYAVLLDYHDDVVVLEPSANPEHVDFYQIKTTTEPHWTCGDLLRSDGPSGCIFSKMCINIIKFKAYARLVALVSNKSFGLKVGGKAADASTQLNATDIDAEEFDKLVERAHNELVSEGPIDPEEARRVIQFIVADLPLENQHLFIIGKVASCLAHVFSNCRDQRFDVKQVYDRLYSEVERCTKFENLEKIRSPSDLLAFKTITRNDITDTLKAFDPRLEPEQAFKSVETSLQRLGYSDSRISHFRREWRKYAALTKDPQDASVRALRAEVRVFLLDVRTTDWGSLGDLMCTGVLRISPRITHLPDKYRDELFLSAAILMENYRMENDEPEADQE